MCHVRVLLRNVTKSLLFGMTFVALMMHLKLMSPLVKVISSITSAFALQSSARVWRKFAVSGMSTSSSF